MTVSLRDSSWPLERLGEAIEAVGRRSGFSAPGAGSGDLGDPPGDRVDDDPTRVRTRLENWVVAAAARLGLEAESVQTSYPEIEKLLRGCAPAIIRLPGDSERRFLALVPARKRQKHQLTALGPDQALHDLELDAVRSVISREVESGGGGGKDVDVESLLASAGITGRRRESTRKVLLDELRSASSVGGCWLIRPAGRSSCESHSREAGLGRLMTTLFAAHTIYFLLWIVSWALLGQGALSGQLDRGWLIAWAMILLTLVPFRLLGSYASGLLAVRAGSLLKRRLLFGALRLDPEEVRHLGTGQLLGRVMESEAVEQAGVSGGFLLTALIELVFAGIILGLGAGGWLHLALLVVWIVVTAWISVRYLRLRRRWTQARLAMTSDLVECMVGHRTRLAQEARSRWNEGEDLALSRHYDLSQSLDRAGVTLQALVPRGWFIVGILGLIPAFVVGERSIAYVAIGVGGVILAFQAFKDLAEGIERILAVVVAWENVREFWQAASRPEQLGQPGFDLSTGVDASTTSTREAGSSGNGGTDGSAGNGAPLLDAQDLVFRYRDRAEPVLRHLDLRVQSGDRILLEGSSGGGKSTLGMLLAACRAPDSGLLLLRGLDLETVGRAGWGRRVVIVPQFHDNHVLTASFAFNVLMGRGWPPSQSDLQEVDRVCRALGLGPLLERMPGGLQQPVGETGWQLSHGERSRLFIARALLQRPDLVILDESFAALDPENLRGSLKYVLEQPPALLVIAHP